MDDSPRTPTDRDMDSMESGDGEMFHATTVGYPTDQADIIIFTLLAVTGVSLVMIMTMV